MLSCDWVSPLPPDRTDIANYTMRVETALAGSVRLNRIHDELATDPSRYELAEVPPFYNVGNDARFHGGSVQAAIAMGGAVIAHDHVVQELLVSTLKSAPGDWHGRYRTLMAQAYGKPGHQAALEFEAGNVPLAQVAAEFSGLEIICANTLFMVTHNGLIADMISNRTGLQCYTLPLPINIPNEPTNHASDNPGLDVLVFGYIGHNRNIESLLDIMRSQSAPPFRLTIAGTIVSRHLRQDVENAIVDGYDVTFPGFLEDDELDRRIQQADLVVNVRSPSMGEVSGSQLRVFTNGGLSVVSNEGWYATLPDETVFKVDPATAAADLKAVIERLADSPEANRDKRRAGYRFVSENHSPDRYREAFLTMLEDCPRAIQHGIGVRIASRWADLFNRAGVGSYIDPGAILEKSRTLSGWSV